MNALAAVAKLVRWAIRGTVYDGTYPATVQGVNADGSIEVLPDDAELGGTGLSVPVDSDPPNTTIVPAIGARCLVGFKASDPRRPYVAEWESGGLGRIGFNGGTRPIARLGDPIELAMPPVVTITGSLGGDTTNPSPPPPTVPVPPAPFLNGVAVVSPAPIAIVQSGHPRLLA